MPVQRAAHCKIGSLAWQSSNEHGMGVQPRTCAPVGEDDVGVHSSHVQVVDQRRLLSGWVVPEFLQLLLDAVPDLLIVGRIAHLHPSLHLDCIFQVIVQGVNQLLRRKPGILKIPYLGCCIRLCLLNPLFAC